MFFLLAIAWLAGIVVWDRYRRGSWEMLARISLYLLPLLACYGVCAIVAGYLLAYFGVPNLFRELEGQPLWNDSVFWGAFVITLMFGAVWTFAFLHERLDAASALTKSGVTCLRFLRRHALPFAGIVVLAYVVPAEPTFQLVADALKSALGILCAGGLVWLLASPISRQVSMRTPNALRRPLRVAVSAVASFPRRPIDPLHSHRDTCLLHIEETLLFFGAFLLLLLGSLVAPILRPNVSLLLLLAWGLYVYFLLAVARRKYWWPLLLSLAAWMVLVNGNPYRQTFPGLDFGCRLRVAQQPMRWNCEPGKRVPPGAHTPLASTATLDRWKNLVGGDKPLVVVATSGGAYRAAYWTAMVLDRLQDEPSLAGLDDHVRIITGASGGMVGAAYYVALRHRRVQSGGERGRPVSVVDQLNRDTESRGVGPYRTYWPYPRDSLSPVMQRLAQRDLFRKLWPGDQTRDRGRVLENQWRSLGATFSDLKQAEADGALPSLILSPTIATTGQPLYISNLDLTALTGPTGREGVEFFKEMPAAHEALALRTAVRMNATCPYVSPAVSLPVEPPWRLVDAGYYDNHGVHHAAAWLSSSEDRTWLARDRRDVILIQIKASPDEAETTQDRDNWRGRMATWFREYLESGAFAWLATPIEAVAKTQGTTQVFRNARLLRQVRELLAGC